jgi:hypothetical protein
MTVAWANFKEDAGEALMPTFNRFFNYMTDEGIPQLERGMKWFADDGVEHLKTFAGYAADAAGAVKDVVGFLNDLPSPVKLAALGAALGAGAGLKLQSGSGALGSLGSALGMSKPMPVFVTNPGFGVGGGGGGAVVTGAPKKGGIRGGGVAATIGLTIAGALAATFGDEASDSYIDAFERNSKWADKLGHSYEAALGETGFAAVKSAAESVVKMNREYERLPQELQTRFEQLGIPESKKEVAHLIDVYDLTPKQKQTTFEILGYDTLMTQIRNINESLDYASRDRRTAITVAYSNAGYDTAGGIPEGGGGPVSPKTRNEKPLRIVGGKLSIDEKGDAYFHGVAAEEVESEADFGRTLGRMRR